MLCKPQRHRCVAVPFVAAALCAVASAEPQNTDLPANLRQQEALLTTLLETLANDIEKAGTLQENLSEHSAAVYALLQIGRSESARKLMAADPAFGDGRRLDTRSLRGTYKDAYVQYLAQAKGTGAAIDYVRDLPDDDKRLPYLWDVILSVAAEREEFVEAQIALSQISKYSRFGGLFQLARAQIKVGEVDAASQSIRAMMREITERTDWDGGGSAPSRLATAIELSLRAGDRELFDAGLALGREKTVAGDVALEVLGRRPPLDETRLRALATTINWSKVVVGNSYTHRIALNAIAAHADEQVLRNVESSITPDLRESFTVALMLTRALTGREAREVWLRDAEVRLEKVFRTSVDHYLQLIKNVIETAIHDEDYEAATPVVKSMVTLIGDHIEDQPPEGLAVIFEMEDVLALALKARAWDQIPVIAGWFDPDRIVGVYAAWLLTRDEDTGDPEQLMIQARNRAEVEVRHRAASAWASIAIEAAKEHRRSIAKSVLAKWEALGISKPDDLRIGTYFAFGPSPWSIILSDVIRAKALLQSRIASEDLRLMTFVIEAEVKREFRKRDRDWLWAEYVPRDRLRLIAILVETGHIDAALDLARWYQGQFPKDREGRNHTEWRGYVYICDTYISLTDYSAALSIAGKIGNIEHRRRVLENIALTLYIDGKRTEAARYARALPVDSQQDVLLAAIDRTATAIKYLRQKLERADN